MKIKILSVLLVLIFTSGISFSQNKYKRYGVKTAIVEYKLSGNSSGTRVMYVDDYGYKEANYTNSSMTVMGMTTTENKGVILIGPDFFEINYKNNTASKGRAPMYDMYAKYVGKDYDELSKSALRSMGYEKTGSSNILGKKCEVWQGKAGSIHVWKGIGLKIITKVMGQTIIEEAVSIKANVAVPSAKFQVPSGIKVEEIPSMDDIYGKMGNDEFEDDDDSEDETISPEEIKKIKSMSYSEFSKLIKKENPGISEEEIKTIYQYYKTAK
jgi:hypothetical protein